jgi:glutathione synthase/RimK-type ligase-like ATP-grasp enzyme
MRGIIILTDEPWSFWVSKPGKGYVSMDVCKISDCFSELGYNTSVKKFSELDLAADYKGKFVLYQSSEAEGGFYKRYIEDLIFFLEKQGAIVIPGYEMLKAHHNKIYMEMMRLKFKDEALKTVTSQCYGSWIEAKGYNSDFPVVIKQVSTSAGEGVYLAHNRKDYLKKIKKASHIIAARSLTYFLIGKVKNLVKSVIKFIKPHVSKFIRYDTTPISSAIVVQNYIQGFSGDYKVLIFGRKYYAMYRKNRPNDFRASGSGQFYEVYEDKQEPLLSFARKLTFEIESPIFGIDIGFDGKDYHLLEFQMLYLGTSALQKSTFWYEYEDGQWTRHDGKSNLEEEFSLAIDNFISEKNKIKIPDDLLY